MICHNGTQLVARSFRNGVSLAARSFYEVLWRWARVSCEGHRMRRSYGTRAVLTSQWQRTCLPRTKTPFLTPRITTSILAQRRSNTTASTAAGAGSSTSEPAAEVESQPPPSSADAADSCSSPTPTGKTDAQLASIERKTVDELYGLAAELTTDFSAFISSATTSDAQTSTKSDEEAESSVSHDLRTLLRTLPSTVVVLTTTSYNPQPKKNLTSTSASTSTIPRGTPFQYISQRGMTLSSFSSLSLFPEPVVTFNIRSPSRTLNALSRCRQFLIHILDVSPEGARIADLFTKGNRIKERMDHSPFSEGVRSGDFRVVSEPGVVGPEREEVALPRLQGAGVRRVLKCEILKGITGPGGHPIKDTLGELHAPKGMIRVGDHILVLAKVLEILDCNEQDSEGQGGYGLSYVDGKYRHVGEPISLRVEDTKATMHKPRR